MPLRRRNTVVKQKLESHRFSGTAADRGKDTGIMYSEKVMDHFQHPRNVGEIENASGVGTVGNAKCGDIMRMYLDIDDERNYSGSKIQDVWLRRCCCDKQHGDGAGKGKDNPGSAGSHQ